MHSKRFSIAAILLALLLAFSFALVMFAGCVKEGEEDDPGVTPGPDGPGTGDEGDPNEAAAAKLVTDESLKEKLLVLYDFEDPSRSSGSALYGYDPFTGAPNSRNGVYSSTGDAQTVTTSSLEAQVTGSSSTTALNVTSGVTLNGALEGLFDADFDGQDANGGYDKGVSVSFWAYNYDMNKQESSETAGTLSWDYNNIVSNGIISVTYGNLRGSTPSGTDALVYPSATTTVGRAAYTEESYNARRNLAGMTDTTMQTFDASATDPYTGWNAIAGNVQTAEEGSVVYEIGESYYQNWRYITVSLQPDGVYFYNNGRLAYAYTSLNNIEWATNSSIFNRTCSQYYRYIAAINAEEYSVSGTTVGLAQLGYQFGMFGIETGIYADDLIVGYGLDADDARALYEDVSGVEYTDDQVACTAAASQEDQAAQNAINAYIANLKTDAAVRAARADWEEDLAYGDYTYDADDAAASSFAHYQQSLTAGADGNTGALAIVTADGNITYSGIVTSAGTTTEDQVGEYYMGVGATVYGKGTGTYIGMSGADNCWSDDKSITYGPGNNTNVELPWVQLNLAKWFGWEEISATIDEDATVTVGEQEYTGTITVTVTYYWYYYMTLLGEEVDCPGVDGDTGSYAYTITEDDCLLGSITYTYPLSVLSAAGTAEGVNVNIFVDHCTYWFNYEYAPEAAE